MRYSPFYQVQFAVLDETALIVPVCACRFSPENATPGKRFALKSTVAVFSAGRRWHFSPPVPLPLGAIGLGVGKTSFSEYSSKAASIMSAIRLTE